MTMKSEHRFSPIPIETSAAILVLSYFWFFLWLKRSLVMALIVPSLYLAAMLMFIIIAAWRPGEDRRYLWLRLLALAAVLCPIFSLAWVRLH